MQLLFQKKGTMPDEHLSLYLSLCDRYQALYAKKPQKPKSLRMVLKYCFY